MKNLRRITIIALLAVLLPGVGYAMPWSWDMFRQISPKPQRDLPPATPEGIVTINGKPYYTQDRWTAAEVENPYKATPESIARGKVMYGIYCSTCHGASGKGEGLVGQKYVPPTDLTTEYVQDKLDGDIYYTITNGGLAIMPSYGDSMNKPDRWHIVNYIKNALKEDRMAEPDSE